MTITVVIQENSGNDIAIVESEVVVSINEEYPLISLNELSNVDAPNPSNASSISFNSSTGNYEESFAGSGDISGPASSVDDNLSTFDGTSGKVIQDSGIASSNVSDAYSHISSDGSSHSFIDQDVTDGSDPVFQKPTVDEVQFDT
ncbi:MAG: hypothetical protein DRP08_04905, partial [Candidatus Aenigmatarchaeota archaeon]